MMTLMRDVTSKGRPITSQADVNKVQNYEDDDVLFSYCKHPEILKYVEAFCGRDVMSVHTSESAPACTRESKGEQGRVRVNMCWR